MHWSPQRSAKVMSNALLRTGLQGKESCLYLKFEILPVGNDDLFLGKGQGERS